MFTCVPIGVIHTPFKRLEDCPRNVGPDGAVATIEVDAAYAQGLMGLERHAYIQVLYWLDRAERTRLVQRSRKDGREAGTFALRSPHRPNPIGSSVVKLLGISGATLTVEGLDCLDGTPLLDIKPAMREDY